MMAVIGLSLPEMIILRKVLKLQLIAVFVSVVGVGIIMTGYLFNLIVKVSHTNPAHPGQIVVYELRYSLSAPATNVVFEDNFLNGQDLVSATFGVPAVETFSSINRDTYTWTIPGPIGPGTFVVTILARVDPDHPAGPGQNVKNSIAIFVNGGWKAASTVTVPVVPIPAP